MELGDIVYEIDQINARLMVLESQVAAEGQNEAENSQPSEQWPAQEHTPFGIFIKGGADAGKVMIYGGAVIHHDWKGARTRYAVTADTFTLAKAKTSVIYVDYEIGVQATLAAKSGSSVDDAFAQIAETAGHFRKPVAYLVRDNDFVSITNKNDDEPGLAHQGDIDYYQEIPYGIIVAWSGDTPPEGWALCDGNNGTPNLSGKFIVGYKSSDGCYDDPGDLSEAPGNTDPGETGGSTNHCHTIEYYDTGDHGDHCIDWEGCHDLEFHNWNPPGTDTDGYIFTNEGAIAERHCLDCTLSHCNDDHCHCHGMCYADNIPPYYVLAWIMKI